jgi:hypothetical protein
MRSFGQRTTRGIAAVPKGHCRVFAAALVAGLATFSFAVLPDIQAVGASTRVNGLSLAQIVTEIHECLHDGGYVNYSTTSGKTFKTALGCVVYSLFGGTLVPLPDLVLVPSCLIGLKNIGIGPASGNLVLQETVTGKGTSTVTGNLVSDCVPISTSNDQATVTSQVPGALSATVSCTNTVPPGTTTQLPLFVGFNDYASSGSVTVTAVVNPDHSIVESNYANNSLTETLAIPFNTP